MSNPLVPAICDETKHEALLPKEALELGMIPGWRPREDAPAAEAVPAPTPAGKKPVGEESADTPSATKSKE